MPRIEVTPGAVQDMGAQVARNGQEMRTVVAALDRARAAGAGMGEAATTAAYEEMCAAWHECLQQVSGMLVQLGTTAAQAASAYVTTDNGQMQPPAGGAAP